MLADLSDAQQTNISDIHEHYLRLDIPYLILTLWRMTWKTFIIVVSKLLNDAIFHKDFSFEI